VSVFGYNSLHIVLSFETRLIKDFPRVMNKKRELIVSNPAIMLGKPIVVGTRITVELILEKLAAGETIEDLLEAHPQLTREAILAALAYTVNALRSDIIYPIEANAI
jgi:uncharacterized protein (DUF433 family)